MVTTYHVTVCTAVRAPPVRVVCCLPPGAAPCSSQACRPGDSLTRARSLLHPGIARQPRGGSRISDGSVESMEAGAADDLAERRSGRRDTLDRIMPIVYEHLRVIARHQLGMREGGGTLSTTGLVHEAYLKLVDQSRVAWRDRSHFFALASVAMRHVLVDRAKARLARKCSRSRPAPSSATGRRRECCCAGLCLREQRVASAKLAERVRIIPARPVG